MNACDAERLEVSERVIEHMLRLRSGIAAARPMASQAPEIFHTQSVQTLPLPQAPWPAAPQGQNRDEPVPPPDIEALSPVVDLGRLGGKRSQ